MELLIFSIWPIQWIGKKLENFKKWIFLFSSKGFSGKQCEYHFCDSSFFQKEDQDCKAKSNNCNGNGRCKCGKCECAEGYVGEFCTCDRDECPVAEKDGKIMDCSGNGKCNKCSANKVPGCTCDAGWTGDDCSVKPVGVSFSILTYRTVEGMNEKIDFLNIVAFMLKDI